jgi:hypothetical protein
MRYFLLCVLLAVSCGLSAADQAPEATPLESAADIIHDLRDFLPETESNSGHADDPIPGFSIKPGSYWTKYKPYNTNGSGCLSRTELLAIVADLTKALHEHYPDEYAAIDTDGHETITNLKIQAYLHRKP